MTTQNWQKSNAKKKKKKVVCKNKTVNHLKVGQQLFGLTLRINPWLWNPVWLCRFYGVIYPQEDFTAGKPLLKSVQTETLNMQVWVNAVCLVANLATSAEDQVGYRPGNHRIPYFHNFKLVRVCSLVGRYFYNNFIIVKKVFHIYIILNFPITYRSVAVLCQSESTCLH